MKRIFTFFLAIFTCISLFSQGLALELLGHTGSGIEGESEPCLKGYDFGGGIITGRISPHKGWRI